MKMKSRSIFGAIGIVVVSLVICGGVASAAVDPAMTEKAARVHEQMDQRITTDEKEAAAAALKALRQRVSQARKDAVLPVADTKRKHHLFPMLKAGGLRLPSLLAHDSDSGLTRAPLRAPEGLGTLYQSIPTGPFNADGTPAVPDYNTTANWANSPPLAKFVDTLPGLGYGNRNNLGQYLTVAVPDITTYPGSDYYEIDLVEYSEQMHRDLPVAGTKLRGYVQVNPGTAIKTGTLPSQGLCGTDGHPCTAVDTDVPPDSVHYLGPAIVAERDRPVRIKFTNRLPKTADGGDLFIPVDTTVMGAGMGPKDMAGADCDPTMPEAMCASYTQNRATIHLHGGRTPWISDGTPHQWVTPAGEDTPYPKGVSVVNVPDMPDPGDGSMTFFYTNQQSARLMFYHDHAYGITRLNVYAGEAAAYVITDPYEQDLVNRGIVPPDQIPLVIQDKTFVDASEIRKYDPLWNWGSGEVDANGVRTPVEGDLWLPHVYMPAQNPFNPDFSGVNPFGRWMYGPWFYPPTAITHPPIDNPYYDPDCSSPDPAIYAQCQTPGQPPLIPATPHPSMGMEAFMDTAVVNGTIFPVLEVDARAYRFRILNAANDRMLNLSLYTADPDQVSPDTRPISRLTEVKTVPAVVTPGWPELWPVDGREGGVPDPATRGPSFLQIASEGGFLPKPAEIAPQPIGYFIDPTAFWVGTVKDHGLALGPAERADVIVDFSGLEGQTLILYNDAPAAWPAGVANYDYFTGAPDRRDTGGYGAGGTFNSATGVWEGGHGTLAGYGPNTRTVMQIVVRSTPADPPYNFDKDRLLAEFTPDDPAVPSLFAKAQEPIIVGQTAYKEIYPDSYFPPNWPWSGIAKIQDDNLSFVTLAGEPVIVPMEPKGIHDEMGASFDPEYGRMSGNLAMQIPNPTTLTANLILYGFPDVPTEYIDNSTGVTVSVNPDRTLADGTQIWKISHNGVDTHPIHFHIFDVQLINRVGWDGQIALPDANEYGWKDTIRISPLMDTIVAVRPRAPALPFGIAESERLLNPILPPGSTMGFNSVDPLTGEAYVAPSPFAGGVTNRMFNFGWEYVWHCHILSHEEMDMMRPIVLNVMTTPSHAPTLTSRTGPGQVELTWTDPTPVNYVTGEGFGNPSSEIGFRIDRCVGTVCNFAPYATVLANQTTFVDTAVSNGTDYRYRVVSYNAAGESPTSNSVTMLRVDTLTPSLAGPQPNGTAITFTASTTGGDDGPYEYSFFWRDSASPAFTEGRGWSPTRTWTWDTAQLGLPVGAYEVRVNVRHVGSSDSYESFKTIAYNLSVITPATGATLSSSVPSPKLIGTTVTFTAAATGGDAGPYVYSFFWRPSGSTTYTEGRTWGTSPTWTWDTSALGLPAGSYVVRVNVQHVLGSGAVEAFKAISFNLLAPATGANLTSSLASPQATGTAITFTAAAIGSDVGPYEYSFLWRTAGATTYTEGRTWGTSPTWTWDTAALNLPTASYEVLVNVRHVVGTGSVETSKMISYVLITPATGVTLIPSVASPKTTGIPVTFTAAATGGDVGPYEYSFYWRPSGSTTYTEGRGWGTSPTWTWDTAALGLSAGSYVIRVNARHVGYPVAFESFLMVAYDLTAPASSVTLTPSVASPRTTGTPITFTANATGGLASYEYSFDWRPSGSTSFTAGRTWGVSPTWTWDTAALGLPVDAYVVRVMVRHVGNPVAFETLTTLGYDLTTLASSVILTPTVTSPRTTGTPVTFTAAATGGLTSYEYSFYWRPSGSSTYTVGRSWGTTPTWTWDTAALGLPVGSYVIRVNARHVGNPVEFETFTMLAYELTAPASSVTLTPSVSSPRTTGTPITFTAAATGGLTSYEYSFYWRASGSTTYTEGRAWGTTPTWMWDTAALGLSGGSYVIRVNVRHVGNPVPFEAFTMSSYDLITPATSVTLTPSLTSPKTIGTPVIFTAAATGGLTNYEYSFYWRLSGSTTYTEGRTWGTSPTWTWDTAALSLPVGSYVIRVNVRHPGNPVVETFTMIAYDLTAAASSVSLVPSVVSPQLHGTAITFTSAAIGGLSGYEYSFFWRPSGSTTYTLGRTWATTPTWTWDTAALGLPAGSYVVRVNVRHVGSLVPFEANNVATFTLN